MKIGLVATDEEVASVIEAAALNCSCELFKADSLISALRQSPGLVLAEWPAPEELRNFLLGLGRFSTASPPIPVVVLAPARMITQMRRAREAGAADVLFTPPDLKEVEAEILQAADSAGPPDFMDRERLRAIRQESLVGESKNFRNCLDELRRAARCDANVLLVGETGTGKEMFARAIHALSRRCGNPYLPVNCASLASTLLESELFGHVKGAFTGANNDRKGRFEAAGAGVLMLDEIGEVDPAFQAKLLRAIEQREFQRVGESQTRPFHARLICATSIDLVHAVGVGAFRRDLLGRIDQFRIELPPLRERRSDILNLARHFLRQHGRGRRVELSRTTLDLLETFDFPGNIRQLENAIVSALARSDPAAVVLPKHLPADIALRAASPSGPARHMIALSSSLSYQQARAEAERQVDQIYLPALLKEYGTKLGAAKKAGLDRETFAKRLEDLSRIPEAESDGELSADSIREH